MSNDKAKIDWSAYAHHAAKRKDGVISSSHLAGRSTQLKGEDEARHYAKPGLNYLIYAAVLALVASFISNRLSMLVAIGCALYALTLIKKSVFRSYSWLKGARGERVVAEALRELESRDFQVLHDLSNGKGNIDHIVIARTGVFVIETKAHEGTVQYIDGELRHKNYKFKRDPLKQVRRQAVCVAKNLEPITGKRIFVNSILCFVNAWVDGSALAVENVIVTRPQFLCKIVTRGKAKFSQTEVERMAAALSNSF